ncbi:MAG: polysaccharide deacetylase family protein [Hyphomicrobium sp.]
MSRRSTKLLKAALSALHYSGADGLIAPFTSGDGVIFMLHHVTPEAPRAFEPNRILKITPDFLETIVRQVIDNGFECISMDDVPRRLKAGRTGKPFAAFTLDDGYKDNRDYAYPVFKKFGVPFTVYVPSDFGAGTGELWWLVLEEAIRRRNDITLEMNGTRRHFELADAAAKDQAFYEIYWWLRTIPEDRARAITRRLAREAGFESLSLCRDLVMTWREIREFAKDPLVTIGAHTNSHYALAKLNADDARREMAESIARVTAETGVPCRHFSYPYGCELSAGDREFSLAQELGVATAVTTRKGLLQAHHKDSLTSLPRLSLNGDFQDPRYVKVLLSGAPFAFWNALQRLSPAAATPAPAHVPA